MAGKGGRSKHSKDKCKEYAAKLTSEKHTANRMVRSASKSDNALEVLEKNLNYNGNKDVRKFAESIARKKGLK
jgi:hypothetical protein